MTGVRSVHVAHTFGQLQNGFWPNFCLRRKVLLVRVEVEDLHEPCGYRKIVCGLWALDGRWCCPVLPVVTC